MVLYSQAEIVRQLCRCMEGHFGWDGRQSGRMELGACLVLLFWLFTGDCRFACRGCMTRRATVDLVSLDRDEPDKDRRMEPDCHFMPWLYMGTTWKAWPITDL